MNNLYIKSASCLFSLFLLLLTGNKAFAQCDNLTLSLATTNSTCLANGKIKITVSGTDLPNITQSNMQFQVSGSKDLAFAHYTDNTIVNLPAGTYTITLKAFCNTIGNWIIATRTATTTITTSYKELGFSLGRTTPTLNCKHTGIIPVLIQSNTGSAPFTIVMTGKPAAYTGTTTFTTSSRSYNVTNLPAGNYTFKVYDDCGYTEENRTAPVGTMTQDYYEVFNQYLCSNSALPDACNSIRASRSYPSSATDPDGYYYFYSNSGEYFEVAFLFNDTGTKTWQPLSSSGDINLALPSPYTRKSMREANAYYTVYLRVKGCTTEYKLRKLSLYEKIDAGLIQTTSGCNQLNISFYLTTDFYGTFCLPYQWRIVKSDNTIFKDWQGPINSRSTQSITNVPLGSKLEFKDSEGSLWSKSLLTSLPKPGLMSSASLTYSDLEPDGLYKSIIYLYFESSFPVNTTFKFLSGPTTPTHTSGTLTTSSQYIYPYSSSLTSSNYQRLAAGTYKFTVTRPGCTSDTISINHTAYRLAARPTYTLTEECDGMSVRFTGGGQMQTQSYSGTISNYGTPYIRIISSSPSSLPYNNKAVVTHGGSLKLPQAGTYYIGLTYYNSSTTYLYRDTIVYSPTPFTLDNTATSSYLCQGEPTGFIRIKGVGGGKGYKYELYDHGVLKQTNKTGVFNYGTAGSTYTIKLYDTICGYSYPQDVTLIDLGIAQISYSNHPDNKFCDSDSIYLKCLTLGQTTYTWSGPGITAAKKNQQNPAVFARDVGAGTHTYTIKVTPETCGTEMTQTVTVTVENCYGARDDYATLLCNTKDTIDVLANDGFPASCASSVVPVITISPTKGTATVVNKKMVYTPVTNFFGKDSLTYSTNCSGTITTAKVYLTVLDYPDNISNADCYITPPGTPFTFKELTRSSNNNVHTLSSPVCGDIDNDGKIEIIVPQSTSTDHTANLLIYELNPATNQLTLQQTLTTPYFFAEGGSSYSIAKVDGNNYAAIFLATSNSSSNSASNKMQLIKYTYNGSIYTESGRQTYSTTNRCQAPAPVITDFNGDGIAEVAVYDKVYNAKTMTLLANGGYQSDLTKGFGEGAHPNDSEKSVSSGSFMVAADVDGDGQPEFIGGNCVYKVTITNPNGPTGNSFTLWKQCNRTDIDGNPHEEAYDGATAVADFDNDGLLDIVVTTRADKNKSKPGYGAVYIWNPRTGKVMNKNIINNFLPHLAVDRTASGPSVAFVGDIDNDGEPEICLSARYMMYAYDYNASTGTLTLKWSKTTTDSSAATTMVLFDFNQDGHHELVYRDLSHLRILNGLNGNDLITPIACSSATGSECPIVADINGDGSAEILVTGGLSGSDVWTGYLRIFSSNPAGAWAPARKVWNQFMYNAVNVNENLTIPSYQLNPATVFPGADGILGTADDIRPYNAFLQQQTILNKNGSPLWLTPDAFSNSSLITTSVSGNSVTIKVGIINKGDAAIGPPVYATLYKNTTSAANKIVTGNANIQINPGDTGFVSLTIADITLINPVHIVIRINDDGITFPYQPECNDTNNEITILNATINRMMKKDATLEGVPHNGTYANPVAALFSEIIEYTITAVNVNTGIGKVIIRDTLPPYLDFVSSNPHIVPTAAGSNPQRSALEWTIPGVASMATTTVTVKATPQAGSSASQPLFINRAWVTVSDTINIPTNSTYHQGASVGIATFSAGFGGNIYNAAEQALDYRTKPKTGIVIVPDEGYRFAGWSHEDYVSLRGNTIQAEEGIMLYDTLTVYGDIELQANFKLEEYLIEYHLNGSVNAGSNPPAYTIESGSITLGAPEKEGDMFTGWTGSNGEEPQIDVIIPKGSTGKLEFYANFLHSGREDMTLTVNPKEDKVWAAKDELFIRTSNTGVIVRVYSPEGILQKQQTILETGETKIKLSRGIYIVTLNNSIGQIVSIE